MWWRQYRLFVQDGAFWHEYNEMVRWSWFPFWFKVSLKYHLSNLLWKIITLLSRISLYSTANTPDASYIIGGAYIPNLVAEFRNDQWNQLDDLNKGRNYHGSITVGTRTMIVGGYGGTIGERWVMILSYYFGSEGSDFFFSFETEVWELDMGDNKVINPSLSYYSMGIGLYAVDYNFCSTWTFLI